MEIFIVKVALVLGLSLVALLSVTRAGLPQRLKALKARFGSRDQLPSGESVGALAEGEPEAALPPARDAESEETHPGELLPTDGPPYRTSDLTEPKPDTVPFGKFYLYWAAVGLPEDGEQRAEFESMANRVDWSDLLPTLRTYVIGGKAPSKAQRNGSLVLSVLKEVLQVRGREEDSQAIIDSFESGECKGMNVVIGLVEAAGHLPKPSLALTRRLLSNWTRIYAYGETEWQAATAQACVESLKRLRKLDPVAFREVARNEILERD